MHVGIPMDMKEVMVILKVVLTIGQSGFEDDALLTETDLAVHKNLYAY